MSDQQRAILPPHNLDAEEAILGALLVDRDAIGHIAEAVGAADFYRADNAAIFAAVRALYERRIPPDVVTIAAELDRAGRLADVGGHARLAELALAVPTSVHVGHYAAIVAKCGEMRRIIRALTDGVNRSYRPDAEPEDVMGAVQAALQAAARPRGSRDFVPIGEALGGALARLDRLTGRGGREGVPTGFADLDRLGGGWQPSELIILAARPAIGKSALALAFARAAADAGHAVAYFSLEMGVDSLVLRLVSTEAGIPYTSLRDLDLLPHDWFRAARASVRLAPLPIYLTDRTPLTLDGIRATVERLRQITPVGLIIVDYLTLMTGPQADRRQGNRQEEVGALSRGLKQLAREFDTPVIALAQLNRAIEQRASRLPQLSDLRESGSIEADADIVLMLHREDSHEPESERRGILEIHAMKHRNGPLGVVPLRSDLATGAFDDLALVARDRR